MSIYMTKRRWLITCMILFLIVLSGVVSYWQFIKPAQTRLATAQDEVAIAQLELESVENQEVPTLDEEQALPSAVLQQKLPVVPLEDEVILALTQAEAVANVEVVQVNYQGNQSFPSTNKVITFDEEVVEETEEETDPTLEVEPEVDEEAAGEPVVDPTLIADWTIPNVEPIQALVQLRTSNYDGVAEFIREIEQFPRILSVDSISYDSYKEQQDAGVEEDVETEYFDFYVMISSFYYPSLAEELQESAPFRSYPEQSDKTDPLYPR